MLLHPTIHLSKNGSGPHAMAGTERVIVELIGFEPTTSGLQSPRSPN